MTRALWLKIRALLARERAERDLHDELDFHIEMQARKHRAAGVDADEAMRLARLEFGNVSVAKDDARDTRRLWMFEDLAQDVRYATRALRRAPAFALAIIVTIGLGVGLNASVFTIFNAYVLRPFEVRDPYALYSIDWIDRNGHSHDFSKSSYELLGKSDGVFSGVVAFRPFAARLNSVPATGDEVTENVFDVLGVHAAIGRTFARDDHESSVVVVSHAAWRNRFAGDTGIIGRRILIRGHSFQVVGVAQPNFEGLFKKPRDFWIPLGALAAGDSIPPGGVREALSLVARLRDGVSPRQAKAFVTTTLSAATPESDTNRIARAFLTSRASALPKTLKSYATFAPLVIAFGLILVLACANVANMLRARGVAREREPATRLALGAGRSRLVRQLVTECVVLVLPASVLGFLIASIVVDAGIRTLFATLPPDLSSFVRIVPLHADARVVVFTVLAAIASALVFGVSPSFQATRLDIAQATRGNSAAGQSPRSSRGALVIRQVAVASLLLIVAGVLLREAARFGRIGTGLRTRDVVSVETRPQSRAAILAALSANPLVDAVAVGESLPLDMRFSSASVTPSGGSANIDVRYNRVSTSYFDVLNIGVRGRGFATGDDGAPVAIVSEAAARRLWPGGNAVGQTIHLQLKNTNGRLDSLTAYQNAQVVGVARDVVVNSVEDGKDQPVIYFPTALMSQTCCVLVRVRGDPVAAKTALDAALERAVPGGVDRIDRLESFVVGAVYPYRVAYWVSLALGLIALVLTMAGVYGVVGYVVGQRTHEIGVRIALGAAARDVLRVVLSQSARQALVGGAIGAAVALGVARLIAANVQGMPSFDVIAIGGALVCVFVACLAAAAVPCWHALRIDPTAALRQE